MRNPKRKSAPKKPAGAKASSSGGGGGGGGASGSRAGGSKMETDAPAPTKAVWRPGVDPLDEDEELDYDPTAYDCLHRLQLDWPCLSFDVVRDELGGPRSTFPHCVTLVAGTQAATAKQNYIAFLRLANLGQGRHGKKAKKAGGAEGESDESDSDDDMSEDDDSEDEEVDEQGNPREPKEDKLEVEVDLEFGPPRMHYRMVSHVGGVNRVRSCPQQPGVVAVWADTAQVRIYDGTKLLKDMAEEAEPSSKPKARVELKPLAQHGHAMEGFALDWSHVKAGRLASGDGRKNVFVWEPQEGGRWAVGSAYQGHEQSVEDISWSPTEETVLASCSVDKTIRIWDTRERTRPMITVQAHDTDVNVISWNRLVAYMMASGADDGALRIWDLRSFTKDGPVSEFQFHKGYVTGLEWCPYEGSMLASSASDNQLAVWDLALERDAEEEAALTPAGNALAPEDMPAQLLFLHAGQRNMKECHWHAQIPGMIASTAEDTMNVFKPSNL